MAGEFARFHAVVDRIPPGKVATYGQIALLAGRPGHARLVGYAMRGASSRLPCHRVVNRLGEMAPEGVFGSQAFQRALLEAEGVTFLANGRIDMARHIWRPSPEEATGFEGDSVLE